MPGGFSHSNRELTVVTPENVTISYQLAGMVTRILALLVDLTIQILLLIGLSIVIDLFQRVGFGLNHIMSFFGMIASFCILLVYNIFFEMIWGGRTPGKRLFRLRVLRDGGYPVNLTSSCIRNILRFIDLGIIPMPTGSAMYLLFATPGLTSVLLSSKYKRIGDYAAGTIVIHEQIASPFFTGTAHKVAVLTAPNSKPELLYDPMVKNLDRITLQDYQIIRRFTARRASLPTIVQAGVAEAIARPLIDRLDMQVDVQFQVQYADILEAIGRRYTEEMGIL